MVIKCKATQANHLLINIHHQINLLIRYLLFYIQFFLLFIIFNLEQFLSRVYFGAVCYLRGLRMSKFIFYFSYDENEQKRRIFCCWLKRGTSKGKNTCLLQFFNCFLQSYIHIHLHRHTMREIQMYSHWFN